MLLGWSLTPQKRDTDLQQESGTLKKKKSGYDEKNPHY